MSKADKKLREVLFSFVSARLETVRDCAVEEVTQRVRGRLVERVVLLVWGGGPRGGCRTLCRTTVCVVNVSSSPFTPT